MERIIRGSLDRIEGDIAVVYSDDNHKFDVSLEFVNDAKPGTRLRLHIKDDQIKGIVVDRDATEKARDRIRKKYRRLRVGRHLKQQ